MLFTCLCSFMFVRAWSESKESVNLNESSVSKLSK